MFLGSTGVKAARKYVGEIDPGMQAILLPANGMRKPLRDNLIKLIIFLVEPICKIIHV